MSRACVGDFLLARGGGGEGWSDFSWPVGHSESYVQACFCEYGQIYFCYILLSGDILTMVLLHFWLSQFSIPL